MAGSRIVSLEDNRLHIALRADRVAEEFVLAMAHEDREVIIIIMQGVALCPGELRPAVRVELLRGSHLLKTCKH